MTNAIKASAGRGALAEQSAQTAPPIAQRVSLSMSVKQAGEHKRKPPSTRVGRKGLLIYMDAAVSGAFRRLVREYDATNQVMGERALKLLFEKLGEPWPG
jgi:hypothetical protein